MSSRRTNFVISRYAKEQTSLCQQILSPACRPVCAAAPGHRAARFVLLEPQAPATRAVGERDSEEIRAVRQSCGHQKQVAIIYATPLRRTCWKKARKSCPSRSYSDIQRRRRANGTRNSRTSGSKTSTSLSC